MGVSDKFNDQLFSVPSNSVVALPYRVVRDEIAGYPVAVQEWLMSKCEKKTYSQWQRELDGIVEAYSTDSNEYERKFDDYKARYKHAMLCEAKELRIKRDREFEEFKKHYFDDWR